ncbi:MAG TPA: hypothetical protein VFJ43_05520, partial [Bacteroidia bacterium]|nr:hypothetical protein [Bacteroidia bacterium]
MSILFRSRIFLSLFFIFANATIKIIAQSPANVTYPVASCVSGGCAPSTTIPTYISASYFDTINEVIYIGGPFDDLSGSPRNGLAAIDAITGNLLSWAPVVNNGLVKAIAKSGDTIFIGGTFSQINGQARGRIAALSASTGALLPVFANGTGNANDTVMALQVYGSKLYVGGRFTTIALSAHTNITRLSFAGFADAWAPVVSGDVKKFGVLPNNIAALIDNNSLQCSEIISISIASGISTLRTQADPGEFISDFAMRGNLAFFVGPFLGLNTGAYSYAAACDLSTGLLNTWNPPLPVYNWDIRSRFNIEYYRDSLFIGVYDASIQLPAYHQLYVSYYNSPNNLRVLKTYQSNLAGLNGYYNDNLLVGNARLFEVERFGQHTSFPNGSTYCHFFSYCLRPPNAPGPFSVAPTPVCPGDSNVIYKVVPLGYFNNYSWSDNNANVFESGTTNVASVDFNENFTGSVGIHVYGVTSCGIVSSAFRGTTVFPKPVPDANAGADDTLDCILSQLMLHGTSVTLGATFDWSGPSGISNSDSLLANLPGNYIVTVHGPNACWKRDTMNIAIDTIRPAILPFSSVPALTCRDTISVLDASGIYPGDSLYWSGPGLTNHDNPAGANQSSNYLLTVINRNNGCGNT